jgi:hypothetical protein
MRKWQHYGWTNCISYCIQSYQINSKNINCKLCVCTKEYLTIHFNMYITSVLHFEEVHSHHHWSSSNSKLKQVNWCSHYPKQWTTMKFILFLAKNWWFLVLVLPKLLLQHFQPKNDKIAFSRFSFPCWKSYNMNFIYTCVLWNPFCILAKEMWFHHPQQLWRLVSLKLFLVSSWLDYKQ